MSIVIQSFWRPQESITINEKTKQHISQEAKLLYINAKVRHGQMIDLGDKGLGDKTLKSNLDINL